MTTSTNLWGHTADGEPVYLFRLTNTAGAYIEVSNLGATWVSAYVHAADGSLADVLLGYDTAEGYLNDTSYMGSTIGRFANRIGKAAFTIDGITYPLEKNDGENTNHAGFSGFHHKVWEAEPLANGIRFRLHSPDGEGGYPGNVEVSASYEWEDSGRLLISHWAITDRPTWINLTNHAYFNLRGIPGSIANHCLHIPSDRILETTPAFIPTGAYVPVQDTVFDFLAPHTIGTYLQETDERLRQNKGYNHCYILKEENTTEMVQAASLYEPVSGRKLLVETDLPGVLVYTAGYLDPSVTGKASKLFAPHTGVCLETQFFPDTPNHPHFPSCLLQLGEVYVHRTRFSFQID